MRSVGICNTTKCFVKRPKRVEAKFLSRLRRSELRALMELSSWHNPRQRHLVTIGIIDDPVCTSLLEDGSKIKHFLCCFPGLATIACKVFGSNLSRMDELHSLSRDQLLKLTEEFVKVAEKCSICKANTI